MPAIVQPLLEKIRAFHDWNKRRKWVTDQEQARLERAEIEAERAAKREAARRYVKERRNNPTEDEIDAEVEKLRQQQQGGNPLLGTGGGDASFNALDTDREPKMPDPLGNSEDSDTRRFGP